MKWCAALFALWASCAAAGPAEDAAQAAEDLRRASALLETVEGRRDRVNALTETIRALENGMAALREGLRRAAIRETALNQSLTARNADIGRLLGTLQMISRSPEPSLLLHPKGPTGTARSGMILADLTPSLQAEAMQLQAQISEMQRLQDLQLSAQTILQRGLVDLQTARIDLSKAISNRTELPLRFTEDETAMTILIATADTLDAFAAGISSLPLNRDDADLPSAASLAGSITPPALGRVLRKFNEADASGIRRPGVIMVTEPAALVSAPAAGTVRFQGPLLDYGNVVILEPATDILFIFAGLGEVFAETGEVVIKGAPLGLMPTGDGGGTNRQDTLYIEVRKDQSPVNPAGWFRF